MKHLIQIVFAIAVFGCLAFVDAQTEKIAFYAGSDIFTVNPDGTGLLNLTQSVATDYMPSLSYDGTEIVFVSDRGGSSQLYTMNVDGSAPTRITDLPANSNPVFPKFNPNGTGIVFAAVGDTTKQIFFVNADGTNLVRLTNNASTDQYPSFSPDGSKIIFIRIDNGGWRAFVMNAQGSGQLPLTDGSLTVITCVYSPNGQKILYSTTDFGIYEMNADGTSSVPVTLGGSDPTYSPDGSRYLYRSPDVGLSDGDLFTDIIADPFDQPMRITNATGQERFPSWGAQGGGCEPMTVEPNTLPGPEVGVPYDQTIWGSGGGTLHTFSVTSGSLPPGLELNSATGHLAGIPTTVGGPFTFTITAANQNGCTASRTYTIDTHCALIFVEPLQLITATVGHTITQSVTASNGVGPYTFSISTGALPLGLSLNPATGEISGTPTVVGNVDLTITATDIYGCSGSRSYTLHVDCPTIFLEPLSLSNGQQGSAYSRAFIALGSDIPLAYSVTAGALPQGLQLDATTGLLSGVPLVNGAFDFTVTATVPGSGCAGGSRNYTLTIAPPPDNTPPVITANITGTLGNNGWYTGDVNISWSVTDGESAVRNQTGCSTQSVSSDSSGVSFTCNASSVGGSASESVTIKRDATAPTLAPSVSPNPVLLYGSAEAIANASDPRSGVVLQSCGPVVTTSVGTKTVNCTATDNAGNIATVGASYRVVYDFAGFFQPVDNLPFLNLATAGSSIPLKFSLHGNHGLAIFSPGFPASGSVSCGNSELVSTIDETVAAGNSSLNYDAATDRYIYVWKTEKSWRGTCRQFAVKLADGSVYAANFRFK